MEISDKTSIAPASSSPFPRWFLIGVAGLMLASILAAGLARNTNLGAARVQEGPVQGFIDIRFDEQADKSVLVRAMADGRTLETLKADGSGFVRGVMRSLMRQRMVNGFEAHAPFRLIRREDGRMLILDLVSNAKMELEGFGPTNSQSMLRLYEAGRRQGTLTKPGGEG